MPIYHVKVVTGSNERVYPCDGYSVVTRPEEGRYKDHPEILGIPEGKTVKIDLMRGTPEGVQQYFQTVYGGSRTKIFIMNDKGKTIDKYPREKKKGGVRELEFRVVEEKEKEEDAVIGVSSRLS